MTLRLLTLSGSLRAASLNTALLNAAARLAPAGIEIEPCRGLGKLPLFNPDLEASDPAPVADLRRRLIRADGLIIASPEYAHGVSGVMKNALDWMVGCEAFVDKPVALLNASARATHAYAALKETLTTMSARIAEAASITLPILGRCKTVDDIVNDPELADALRAALAAFGRHVRDGRG